MTQYNKIEWHTMGPKLFWNCIWFSNPNQSPFHSDKQEEIVLEMDWFFLFSHTYCIESLRIILAFFKALFEGLKKKSRKNTHEHENTKANSEKLGGPLCLKVNV